MACRGKMGWVSLEIQAWTGSSYLCDLGALERLDEFLKFSDLGHGSLRGRQSRYLKCGKSRENNTLSPNLSLCLSGGRVWAMCSVT